MVDDLDAIAIQIKHSSIEDAIVAASEGRSAIWMTASGECGGIKVSHRRFTRRRKCYVSIATRDTESSLSVGSTNEQFFVLRALTLALQGSGRNRHRQFQSQQSRLDCQRICIPKVGAPKGRKSRQKVRARLSDQCGKQASWNIRRKERESGREAELRRDIVPDNHNRLIHERPTG